MDDHDARMRDEIAVRLQTVGLGTAIAVTVRNGDATLRGRVASSADREAAGHAALATRGLNRVSNEIEVVPPRPSPDAR